jgi:hypothetical protein
VPIAPSARMVWEERRSRNLFVIGFSVKRDIISLYMAYLQ